MREKERKQVREKTSERKQIWSCSKLNYDNVVVREDCLDCLVAAAEGSNVCVDYGEGDERRKWRERRMG